MAVEITKEIQARIDKARRAAEEISKQPDPFEGMSEAELADLQGVIIDSGDSKEFEQYIKEHYSNETNLKKA